MYEINLGNLEIDNELELNDLQIDEELQLSDLELDTMNGVSKHSKLKELDYDSSGHIGFQRELISGVNIKTINEETILGEGNIQIESKFSDDIILAGNWTQVGNFKKSATGTAIYEAQGKTPIEVITDMLSQDVNPAITQPSVSIYLSNSGNHEVGNTIQINADVYLNEGSYSFDSTTGVIANAWEFSDTKGNTEEEGEGNSKTINFNDYNLLIEDSTNYTVFAKANYGDGNIPNTQLRKPYPAGQIKAGEKTKTSSAIKGVRYMFFGASTTVKSLNSSNIRSLVGQEISNNFTITIPQNCLQVIISIPTNKNKKIISVEDVGAFGTDIKSRFIKSTVQVEGANSYNAISYDTYVYQPDAKLDANTYKVTLG